MFRWLRSRWIAWREARHIDGEWTIWHDLVSEEDDE